MGEGRREGRKKKAGTRERKEGPGGFGGEVGPRGQGQWVTSLPRDDPPPPRGPEQFRLTFDVDAEAERPLLLLDAAVVVLVTVAVEALGAAARLDQLLDHPPEAADLLETQQPVRVAVQLGELPHHDLLLYADVVVGRGCVICDVRRGIKKKKLLAIGYKPQTMLTAGPGFKYEKNSHKGLYFNHRLCLFFSC